MVGLREKQKAKRNSAILGAASTLFKQSGYESARIEAIAEMAEVSVGTFYNYYENKADLLLAIVMPAEQLDPMYAAGPAPRWVPASAGPPPTDVASFIAAAHTLPRWRSLRIAFGETRIALDRPAQEER